MRRKDHVRGGAGDAAGGAGTSGREAAAVRIPAGYSPREWLDTSDVMGAEAPESVEEVTLDYGREDDGR